MLGTTLLAIVLDAYGAIFLTDETSLSRAVDRTFYEWLFAASENRAGAA